MSATWKNTDAHNSTYEEILSSLNDAKIKDLLPVTVYLSLMIIIGTFGNSLVIYIYLFRMKAIPSHYFIVVLASLDLFSCTIGIPFEITDLVQPYVFKADVACKILRFVLGFTIISSCLTLICVAFDRYFKVCKPLRGFSIGKVKKLCLVSLCIGATLSWPALVIFGTKTVATPVGGINGTECSTADDIAKTQYPLIYFAVLILAFVVTFTAFVALYIRIGYELWKRKRSSIGYKSGRKRDSKDSKCSANRSRVFSDDESGSKLSDSESGRRGSARKLSLCLGAKLNLSNKNENKINKNSLRVTRKCSKSSDDSGIRMRCNTGLSNLRTVRTTIIFLTVSVAFVISFLPFLVINVLKNTKIMYHVFHTTNEEVLYNIFVRSYCLNNVINPVIYSVLNLHFRKQCKRTFRQCIGLR